SGTFETKALPLKRLARARLSRREGQRGPSSARAKARGFARAPQRAWPQWSPVLRLLKAPEASAVEIDGDMVHSSTRSERRICERSFGACIAFIDGGRCETRAPRRATMGKRLARIAVSTLALTLSLGGLAYAQDREERTRERV